MIRPAAIGVAAALVLLAGCAGSDTSADVSGAHGTHRPGSSAWHGTPITNGYPLPDQEFTDTDGETVVPATDVDSPVSLVFFGYTHCPDICNVVLANVASALRGVTPEVRSATTMLFITTDPARDTPEAVREYLGRFDPTYRGLVAPVDTVAAAAKDLHVSYERPDGSTSDYEVDHGTYTTAFVNGKAKVVWAADTTVADIRADLTRLARLA